MMLIVEMSLDSQSDYMSVRLCVDVVWLCSLYHLVMSPDMYLTFTVNCNLMEFNCKIEKYATSEWCVEPEMQTYSH